MHPRTWLARTVAGAAVAALLVSAVTACGAPPPRLLLNGIVADRSAPDGIRVLPAGPAASPVIRTCGSSPSSAAGRVDAKVARNLVHSTSAMVTVVSS